jgi:hypothetical protein
MDSWLIGCTSEVPTRNKLADFARFITSTSLMRTDLPPAKDRIKITLDQLAKNPVHRPSGPAKTQRETLSAPQTAEPRLAPLTAAKTSLVENKLEAAVAAARCAVRENPGCKESVALLADALFRSRNWNHAAEQYQSLTRWSPHNRIYWHRRWECSVRQDHAVLAALILDEALALHPEWAGTWQEMETPDHGAVVSNSRSTPVSDNTNSIQVEGRYAFE